MLPNQPAQLIPTHWGTFRANTDGERINSVTGAFGTQSQFWDDIQNVFNSDLRISRPAIRKSFLEHGEADPRRARGEEPFIQVPWDVALDLAAHHLKRISKEYGNQAFFGGSYGWSSAGRFHHAQSQLHRFLNVIGGYTRSVNSYSYAAAEVILPHVLGGPYGLTKGNTPWSSIGEATELIVAFGGISRKNAKTNPGGVSDHYFESTMEILGRKRIPMVSISPIRDDSPQEVDWLPIIPNTDVALMLALAYVIATEGLADRDFLTRYCTGYEIFEAYLLGRTDAIPKNPRWASAICRIDAETIVSLARKMAASRTMIMVSWSLQRAEHGEQPYWMAITLAAMLGQIGLPGAGFGFGYAAINSVGHPEIPFRLPSLPQLKNPIETFIPVARIAEMLLRPNETVRYNGQTLTYPDIKMVYWAGGNPFHHHQDLNKLRRAWAKPEVVIVNDSWWNATTRHADIVLPAKLQFERNDIVCTKGSRHIFAAAQVVACPVDARSDYEIFSSLAARMGQHYRFTEDRSEEQWLRHLYAEAHSAAAAKNVVLPDFNAFWAAGVLEIEQLNIAPPMFSAFRLNPVSDPLATPSGKIEIFSQTIASFASQDCCGHSTWAEPSEWLGAERAVGYPLHLLSNQPSTKLHSQFDHSPYSRSKKVRDREPLRIHPDDAAERGIAQNDIVKVFNDRGAFLAAATLSFDVVRGATQIATGAWLDLVHDGPMQGIEIHGNPNVVTHDRPTSEIAQGSSANTCLVQVVRFDGPLPPLSCYKPPAFEPMEPGWTLKLDQRDGLAPIFEPPPEFGH